MGRKKEEPLKNRLKRLNILKSRYENEQNQLQELKYSEKQANDIILRRYSQNTVEKLIKLHSILQDKGFTHEELIKIARHNGGSNNLQAVKDNIDTLLDLRFNKEDILKMVAYNGGSNNLKAVIDNMDALLKLGFDKKDILRIVAHSGGSKNLQAVIDNMDALLELRFNKKNILKVVAHSGGSKNLQAVKDNLGALLKFGFDKKDILKMVAHDGGSKNLQAVKENMDALLKFGFDKKDILKMVAHDGGSKNLQAVKDNMDALLKLDFNKEDILKMVAQHGGSNNLKAVKNNLKALLKFGFNKKDILKMVAHHGGSKNLQAVKDNLEALLKLGFNKKNILKMVAHHGGSKNLQAVKDNLEALLKLGFNKKDILKMVAHDGGSNNLKAVKDNLEALLKLGFDKEDILKMVGHSGGSKNLQAVKDNLEALLKLDFNKEDILKMVAYHGGSKNLQAVKGNLEALLKLGFNKEDILKMVAHHGGSKNLQAVRECYEALKDSSLNRSEIAGFFRNGQEGRERLEKLLSSASISLSSWELLFGDNTTLFSNNTHGEKTRKQLQGLQELSKDRVFSHFEHSRDKKGGWFILNPGYYCSSIREHYQQFFKDNDQVITRYFSKSRKDGQKLYVSLKHPALQNATAVAVQALFTLLIRTRVYVHQENNEVLLEKSHATGFSDLDAIVRFDGLVELWHKEFPVLNKAIIGDVLASWFIAEINQWREKRYDVNEDHKIPPEWIEHRGEFVFVRNYSLLKDNFEQILTHWQDPLPQDLSLNTSLAASSGQNPSSFTMSSYAEDMRQQVETEPSNIPPSSPRFLSSHALLFGDDAISEPPGKRKREDELDRANKKPKIIEEDNAFSQNPIPLDFVQSRTQEDSPYIKAHEITTNGLQQSVEGDRSSLAQFSLFNPSNKENEMLMSNTDFQLNESFGDETGELFDISPMASTPTNTTYSTFLSFFHDTMPEEVPTNDYRFFTNSKSDQPSSSPTTNKHQQQELNNWVDTISLV